MKREFVYEGKAKRVYKTDDEKVYLIEYKDDATAFNGEKKGTIENKGAINNKISAMLFELLENAGIETHFVKLIDERRMLVKAVEIIPIEVIVRNVAAGSLAKRLGFEEGTQLETTVLEFCYKNDELGDPLINDYHIQALKLAGKEEVEVIKQKALKINEILVDFFGKIGLKLIDFKLEFGRYDGRIILADEISPDTCRLWDKETNQKMDKDRFRRDLGKVEDAYKEVLRRVEEVL
ncbi:phosphoribosylaminoimidazolesuccinocarboxamide synthase [Caloranaerobacter azorensis]|uniref:Phosphoribosylaminoimidazole-succinocarboxamide synthase n=2 Tax=Caloranaerobacter azorensis TaxID=116090 RepID=A0A096BFU3_9FIRM|nr:phosphoribosylaminoimidazolesuccinocarboxamide synthase [Caloranaerobacter azorensis]KGG80025.1 phosphoribosylaminoimidazole-succinocarboxamide synthase [Caloranaerobacter azorensis H53214]QIB27422.1 phosphoribosylaminoimidazolesuccinocarboxamide synthase [Caloranaerobacter azorensis]